MSETTFPQTESSGGPATGLRVAVVDDHDLFRTGLRTLLEEQGIEVVGEAASGEQALEVVLDSAPDVVVMDLNMPGMTGIEATRHVTSLAPLTRVLVLTIAPMATTTSWRRFTQAPAATC